MALVYRRRQLKTKHTVNINIIKSHYLHMRGEINYPQPFFYLQIREEKFGPLIIEVIYFSVLRAIQTLKAIKSKPTVKS